VRKDTQPRRNVGLRSRPAHAASNDTVNAALDLDTVNAAHQVEQVNVAERPPAPVTTPTGRSNTRHLRSLPKTTKVRAL
jgi:hypothetical protein